MVGRIVDVSNGNGKFNFSFEDILLKFDRMQINKITTENNMHPEALDLRSEDLKIIINVPPQFSHFIQDGIGSVCIATKRLPKGKFIFFEEELISAGEYFKNFLIEYMSANSLEYVILPADYNRLVLINNVYFYHFDAYETTPPMYNELHESMTFCVDKTLKPTKKVYVSRRHHESQLDYLNAKPLAEYESDEKDINLRIKRVNDEELLEKFFADNGFEIIYSEEFNTMVDRIKYFHDVKLLVGLSGSSLANMYFMQNKTHVIDISTTQILENAPHIRPYYGRVSEEVHAFFYILAQQREIYHYTVPNFYRSSEDVIKNILGNKVFMNLISSDNY